MRGNTLTYLITLLLICSSMFLISHDASIQTLRKHSLLRHFDVYVNSTPSPLTKEPYLSQTKVAYLLQQSIVRPSRQLSRLRVVDSTWANWLQHDEVLYAAVTSEEIPPFQTVIPIFLNAASSPFHRMMASFMHILLHTPRFDWFVYANDHTFMIPAHLRSYLHHLSSTDFIFAGNRLSLQYNSRNVHFLSGGAGVVLSVSALHAVLVSWSLVHNDNAASLLPTPIKPCDYVIFLHRELDEAEHGYRCLAHWLRDTGGMSKKNLGVHLSSHASISIVKEASQVIEIRLNINNKQKVVSWSSLRMLCSCDTKWTQDNPGVVLASCLQEVFGINAISSTQDGSELFNVYGPVRLVLVDVDQWYREMKKGQSELPDESISRVAQNVISFHYVSEAEAALLYEILCDKNRSSLSADVIFERWPRGNHVGDYSRPLRSLEEAVFLKQLLTQHLHGHSDECK